MRCIECGNEMRSTADDYIQGLCAGCRNKNVSEKYSTPLQGWICPRCGTVHSPFVPQCHCSPPTITSNTIMT